MLYPQSKSEAKENLKNTVVLKTCKLEENKAIFRLLFLLVKTSSQNLVR